MAAIARAHSVEVNPTPDDACSQHPVLHFFLSLWSQKRGKKAMPSRADFRPSDMRAHIGSIVVAEALPDFADFRFKLVGTEVAKYFLADCTGRTIKETYPPPDDRFGDCVLKNYRDAASGRSPLHTRLHGIRWSNGFNYDMQAVYLPLSENGETATGVLTAFAYEFSKISVDAVASELRRV